MDLGARKDAAGDKQKHDAVTSGAPCAAKRRAPYEKER